LETAQQSSALPLEAVANQMQIAQIWAAITAHRSGSGTVQNGGSARGYFGPLFTSSGIYLWASTARW
jgi:hypothetical protein